MKGNKIAAIILGSVLMTSLFITPVFANIPANEETQAAVTLTEPEDNTGRIEDDTNADSSPSEEVTEADGQPADDQENTLTPEGNMTLVDDIATKDGKQFITLTSRSGHYYYLIIDRSSNGAQNVYFLNQVDERDLYAQMNESDQKEIDNEREEAEAKAAEEAQRKAEEERKAAEEARAAQEAAAEKDESESSSKSTPSGQEQFIRIGNKEIPLKSAMIVTGVAAVLLIFLTIIAFRKHNAAKAQVPDPDAGFEDEYDDEYVLEEDDEEDPDDINEKE